MWYVYIVRCAKGALYTGITNDLVSRLKKHNSGTGAKAIRALGVPVKLVYLEKFGTNSDALKREHKIKQLPKSEKEKLIGSRVLLNYGPARFRRFM